MLGVLFFTTRDHFGHLGMLLIIGAGVTATWLRRLAPAPGDSQFQPKRILMPHTTLIAPEALLQGLTDVLVLDCSFDLADPRRAPALRRGTFPAPTTCT